MIMVVFVFSFILIGEDCLFFIYCFWFLVGLVFFVLGVFKFGGLIGYFFCYILVGWVLFFVYGFSFYLCFRCIGGVGVFFIEIGFEVFCGFKEEGFEYNFVIFKFFFEFGYVIVLWIIFFVLVIFFWVIIYFWYY